MREHRLGLIRRFMKMKKKSGMMAFSVLALSLLPMSTGATAATIPG